MFDNQRDTGDRTVQPLIRRIIQNQKDATLEIVLDFIQTFRTNIIQIPTPRSPSPAIDNLWYGSRKGAKSAKND